MPCLGNTKRVLVLVAHNSIIAEITPGLRSTMSSVLLPRMTMLAPTFTLAIITALPPVTFAPGAPARVAGVLNMIITAIYPGVPMALTIQIMSVD